MLNRDKFLELEKDRLEYINEAGTFTFTYLPVLNGEDKLKQCAYLIGKSKRIAIITGAGISTDSEIPDYRGNDGVYSAVPEDVFSIMRFMKNPINFYQTILNVFGKDYEPNKIHHLLKKLSEDKTVSIISQNIDSLEKKLEINEVIEVHGHLRTGFCVKCGTKYKLDLVNKNISYFKCPKCKNGYIKPDIVFYGEDLHDFEKAERRVSKCDLLIILGTSMMVEPVSSLYLSTQLDTPIIVINRDITPIHEHRMVVDFQEDIRETLEGIFKYIY